jgi:nucleotide-binding universal stress UspA family protein
VRPSILCPVDFSSASAGALQYAAAIADHFAARLIVLSVHDPSWTAGLAPDIAPRHPAADRQRELQQFVTQTMATDPDAHVDPEHVVTTGKPSQEILRIARERSCNLIVMSAPAHRHAEMAPRFDDRAGPA